MHAGSLSIPGWNHDVLSGIACSREKYLCMLTSRDGTMTRSTEFLKAGRKDFLSLNEPTVFICEASPVFHWGSGTANLFIWNFAFLLPIILVIQN